MPIDYLPPHLQPPAYRLRAVLMSDTGLMLILGATMLARGASYWALDGFTLIHPLDVWLPMWATSGAWMGLGLALIAVARWHASWVGRLALGVSVGFFALWGAMFLYAPGAAFSQRGVIYLGLTSVIVWSVWRGRRGEIRIEEKHGRSDSGG